MTSKEFTKALMEIGNLSAKETLNELSNNGVIYERESPIGKIRIMYGANKRDMESMPKGYITETIFNSIRNNIKKIQKDNSVCYVAKNN